MGSILQAIEDWLKKMLVSGIIDNLIRTFYSVNEQVGQVINIL